MVFQPVATVTLSDCNPAETATNAALLQYSPFPDWEGLGNGLGSSLSGGATNVVPDASNFLSGLVAYLQATPDIGEAVSLIDTSNAALQAIEGTAGALGLASVTQAFDQLEAFTNGFQSLVNETDDIFGGTDWINPFSGPELTRWLTAFAADAGGGIGHHARQEAGAALEAVDDPPEAGHGSPMLRTSSPVGTRRSPTTRKGSTTAPRSPTDRPPTSSPGTSGPTI